MKFEQRTWTPAHQWELNSISTLQDSAHLVLVFGATALLKDTQRYNEISQMYPTAHVLGCSTAGEIINTSVQDDSLVLTAITFEKAYINGAKIKLSKHENSFSAGSALAKLIPHEDLTHVFLLSDGLHVNGSDLVRGVKNILPEQVTITGGLAGDGPNFSETLVFWDSPPQTGVVAILGFYGSSIKVQFGSLGGWDPFGPERQVTRSRDNVLFELDGQSALELYKKYLGDHAKGLPATGLLFPLSLRTKTGEQGVVRTILGINAEEQSLTFAGDVPEGSYARLMKANFDRLIDGSIGAAKICCTADTAPPELAILISCVGRKLVLKQRVEEEIEGPREVLGKNVVLTGFYSYGEISPFKSGEQCELHNQTMTITTLREE
ncbi:MAG: FIST C-terminal domain-containing protein [Ignavibacteria bacterium]|nr:FIST C-terminal domain-containing protein [Ignavibacteria bacterium]